MIECLILGDSIAVGIQRQKRECDVHAKIGITSKQYNVDFNFQHINANTVVISLGSNDYRGIDTMTELEKLRNKITAKTVYWILPANKPYIADWIYTIAPKGDKFIEIDRNYLERDGVHPVTPQGYKKIADQVR